MKAFLLFLLKLYRAMAPARRLLPVEVSCRFHPTCSTFATEAIEKHGAARGTALAARRLLRCHPFHKGGLDPVPER